jgi:FG-GAP-like repeat
VSAIGQLHIKVNHAPVVTAPASITLHAGQLVPASTLFSATDADNDALGYYFQDGGAPNSGHLVFNGTDYGNGAYIGVSAAELANLTYVAGAAGTVDDLSIHLSDGRTVSATGQLHINVDHALAPAPDFNNDGNSDLLLLNDTTHQLYVCEMNGAQIGVNAASFTISASAGWRFGGLGEFNGDGKSDVVLLNDTTHQVYVCEMDGTALSTNGVAVTVRADLGWSYKGLGDFNGDGKSDIILFNDATHGVYVCEMDGLQMGANALSGTINAAAGWTYQTLGDFNGDGKADFLFLNAATHGVEVWQMDGTQLAADQVVGSIDAASGWHFKDTADFNGDGKTDLLLLNDANNHVMIWQMNGTSTPTQVDLGAAPAGTHFLDKGDFNGDGKADLAFLNDATNAVTVWQMNGAQVQATAVVGTVPAGYHYMDNADFNGDRKTDLVFQNDATRAEQLWQMNGTAILDNSQMVVLAAGWHMVV